LLDDIKLGFETFNLKKKLKEFKTYLEDEKIDTQNIIDQKIVPRKIIKKFKEIVGSQTNHEIAIIVQSFAVFLNPEDVKINTNNITNDNNDVRAMIKYCIEDGIEEGSKLTKKVKKHSKKHI